MFSSDSEREKQFLDELYEQYYDVLFRYCLPYLNRDIDSSADCVHMVFDVAAAKVKTLMKHPNIGGWMYATAKNCIKKELRRIKMEQTKFERLVDSMPTTTQIDPILEDEVDALRDRIVDTLNEAEDCFTNCTMLKTERRLKSVQMLILLRTRLRCACTGSV